MSRIAINNRNKCYFTYLVYNDGIYNPPKRVLHANVPLNKHLEVIETSIKQIKNMGEFVVRYDSRLKKVCYYDPHIRVFIEIEPGTTCQIHNTFTYISITNTTVGISTTLETCPRYAYRPIKYDTYHKVLDFTDPTTPVVIKE